MTLPGLPFLRRPRLLTSGRSDTVELGRLAALALVVALCGPFHVSLGAATPPASSPLARGEHPRLLMTAAQVPAIRQRINQYYRADFQRFLDLLKSPPAPAGDLGSDPWGAMNFAFLAVLDPGALRTLGFSLPGSAGTSAQACDVAMTYVNRLLPNINAGESQAIHGLMEGIPRPLYTPTILAYDWCSPYWSTANKTTLATAFMTSFNQRYATDQQAQLLLGRQGLYAYDTGTATLQDLLSILAIYGDGVIPGATQSLMYDKFAYYWLDRLPAELDSFYSRATNWHEASGGYFHGAYLNLALGMAMASDALGTDFIAQKPFFTTAPIFMAGNLLPYSMASACGSGGSRCPDYMSRWGTEADTTQMNCRLPQLTSGLLRRRGHPNAGLAKWVHTTALQACSSSVLAYSGLWTNTVWYWFLFGDAEVASTPPEAVSLSTSQRLGLDEYTLKSGYGQSDSLVTFWAMPFRMYGHAMDAYGHFTLHKYGELVLRTLGFKGGDVAKSVPDGASLAMNNVGIYRGSSDPYMTNDGAVLNPYWQSRGVTDIRNAGTVRAESLSAGGYDADYVFYDNSPSWSQSTATVAQRELVYLRGVENAEFVVLFDRMNTVNASHRKVWKVWVPSQPDFTDATPSVPRAGKWTSSTGSVVRVTNQLSSLKTPNYESAPTHGRMFLKVLSPDQRAINFLGGAGTEFQTAHDDGSTFATLSMTDAMRAYLGWGRIEVVPTVARNYDTFLTVLQFGNATTLTSPSNVTKVTSSDGKMVGAHVQDTRTQALTMFAVAAADAQTVAGTSYAYTPVTQVARHVVASLLPSRDYYVQATASGGQVVVTLSLTPLSGAPQLSTNSGGVLKFTLDGARVVGPPSAPQGIRVGF
ncbi:MAG: hypothetical protein U0Q12_13280 [Vicinamibacterales bacterium]